MKIYKFKLISSGFFTALLLILTTCTQVVKEVTNWTKINNNETVSGQYYLLENDGIKLFLPKSFKKYATVEYLDLLDSLAVKKEDLKIESLRLKKIRNLEGNHYLFFDKTVNATLIVNSIPYTPITKTDANYILGSIRVEQMNEEAQLPITYKKISAKYFNKNNSQIFKAVFKIQNTHENYQIYQNLYFISSQSKTIIINLSAPFEAEFDNYIGKIKF